MIGQALDRLIGVVSPSWAARRLSARATMEQIAGFSGGVSGYDAGRNTRLTRNHRGANLNENAIPRNQIASLRWRAWDLWRNNPHARKIIRTIEAKAIGCGMQPQSHATNAAGEPQVEFRNRAQEIWNRALSEIDYRGRPGRGGQHFADLQRTALRGVILGGEVLLKFRPLSRGEQAAKRVAVPLQVQLIHAERLAEEIDSIKTGNRVYRGIEFDHQERRTAYWLLDQHPSETDLATGASEPRRIPADEILHLFVGDDIDQHRGTSWFAPALNQARDTADYQYNELKSSAIAACVTLGVRRPSGTSGIGLEMPSDWDLVDADGNALTAMQPGMIINLGTNGDIVGFNPQRPNSSAEQFIQHMLRSESVALPGVKSSTITGDYRNSSFSSERSADNDAWPELEGVQEWFATSFLQPIYERVITAAIESGLFEGIVTAEEFADRKRELLACDWQGPVPRSINPVDDAKAARDRIAGALTSPQIECSALGYDWQSVLRQIAEFRQFALDLGLPEELVNQFCGQDPKLDIAKASAAAAPSDAASGPGRMQFATLRGLNGHSH